MKTTYTVPEVPGSKRQSGRPYTHAVIGHRDAEREVATWRAERAANRARDLHYSTKNWKDWNTLSVLNAGDMYDNHNHYRVAALQGSIDIAKDFMAKYPTLGEYLTHLEADFEAQVAAKLAKGNGGVVVLRWSMSAANAAKGLSEFERGHSGLRVVECVPVVKGAK